MAGDNPLLQEMRCRCCGTFMGYICQVVHVYHLTTTPSPR